MNRLETILEGVESYLSWAPPWAVSLAVFATAVVAALLAHRLWAHLANRFSASRDIFWRSVVQRTEGPMRLALVVVALAAAASVAPLSDREAEAARHGLLLCFIALLGWTAKTVVHIWTTIYTRRFKLDAEDNLLARKHVTQSRIMQRIAEIAIVTLAFAAALMTFDSVRQYGVSLMASAGAAGIVAGLALQPVLKNLFAGIQLAVTQPIRIDDALLVEGEWGNVEEITSTYVVVRLWDWRRLILPLAYFIERPFQNWTREGAALIGVVTVYLDYEVPVEAVRAKVLEIAQASKLWDGRVVNTQVTDFKQNSMELRILASAANSGKAFDLRCELREKLIAFLRETYPHALPRLRADIALPPEAAMGRALRAGQRGA